MEEYLNEVATFSEGILVKHKADELAGKHIVNLFYKPADTVGGYFN